MASNKKNTKINFDKSFKIIILITILCLLVIYIYQTQDTRKQKLDICEKFARNNYTVTYPDEVVHIETTQISIPYEDLRQICGYSKNPKN